MWPWTSHSEALYRDRITSEDNDNSQAPSLSRHEDPVSKGIENEAVLCKQTKLPIVGTVLRWAGVFEGLLHAGYLTQLSDPDNM